MSGYKSPPYSILSFWSMKSALQLTPGERSVDAFNDVLEYAAEIEFDMAKGRKESPLVQIVTGSDLVHAYGVRHVSAFTRGVVHVSPGDWVIATASDGASYLGRVGEMVEFYLSGSADLRMLLEEARPIHFTDTTRSCSMSVSCEIESETMLIRMELTALHGVHCEQREGSLTITYTF